MVVGSDAGGSAWKCWAAVDCGRLTITRRCLAARSGAGACRSRICVMAAPKPAEFRDGTDRARAQLEGLRNHSLRERIVLSRFTVCVPEGKTRNARVPVCQHVAPSRGTRGSSLGSPPAACTHEAIARSSCADSNPRSLSARSPRATATLAPQSLLGPHVHDPAECDQGSDTHQGVPLVCPHVGRPSNAG